MTFDAKEFRNALGCFATGITVVTATNANDEPLGVTINSFSSVSLDPPLVLFSLARVGGHCQEFITAGKFAVNILTPIQQQLSDRFSMARDNRFEGIDYHWERTDVRCSSVVCLFSNAKPMRFMTAAIILCLSAG